MLKYIACWNDWLGRHMFFVVLSALLSGFLLSLPLPRVWNMVAVVLFSYITFIASIEISFRDFFHVLVKPWITFGILLLIHCVIPLIAWGIGLLFYPNDIFTRMGLLIGFSIPIGVTSIIWTSLVNGDVALAVVAVMLDTLIGPFLLPAVISLVTEEAIHINYTQMLVGVLLMVTIPSILGMALNDLYRGKLVKFAQPVAGFTSKVAIFLVVFINANIMAPEITWNASLVKLLIVLLILIICSFIIGCATTYILKERRFETVAAVVYCVGMRNFSFGLILATTYFPAAVAIPVTLAMLYQQPLAALVSSLFNRFDQRRLLPDKSQ
ncbi:bile acid:sodium symporter family protein [Desulfofundulus salinus]|uniref:Bile acid:sodium symporter family protein n=1 Tax=Desulfofundulus salinus TaxID=2419843 RepID=A0A494WUN6_9FIRM|nr:bile acid:sodium symporter [Desulfofundulus salinum]RKO65842.1 bile acid:sodium symporter family protein [Desulfofundulus salinum]